MVQSTLLWSVSSSEMLDDRFTCTEMYVQPTCLVELGTPWKRKLRFRFQTKSFYPAIHSWGYAVNNMHFSHLVKFSLALIHSRSHLQVYCLVPCCTVNKVFWEDSMMTVLWWMPENGKLWPFSQNISRIQNPRTWLSRDSCRILRVLRLASRQSQWRCTEGQ